MSEVRELCRMIALDRAYALADGSCETCGLPTQRIFSYGPSMDYACGSCVPKNFGPGGFPAKDIEIHDVRARKAIERLMKIVQGE
jgi:hypothetical protein